MINPNGHMAHNSWHDHVANTWAVTTWAIIAPNATLRPTCRSTHRPPHPHRSAADTSILAPFTVEGRLRQLAIVGREVVQLAQPLEMPFAAVFAHRVS
mmetsp:Transcript_358/g.639  ORF Transcript_358/g.639 Transcript_358/m.639 type:complete len:98 (+) Transcript_358:538-831(+)